MIVATIGITTTGVEGMTKNVVVGIMTVVIMEGTVTAGATMIVEGTMIGGTEQASI
jgi:hypothetical protein